MRVSGQPRGCFGFGSDGEVIDRNIDSSYT